MDEGLCRVGWSTEKASLDLGTDRFSFGFGGTGMKSNNKQFEPYGEAFGNNDIIGCLLDLDNLEISFTKNGKHLGRAFSIFADLKKETFYPSVVLKNAEMAFNFGTSSEFKHQIPSGFIGVSKVDKNNMKVNPFASPVASAEDFKVCFLKFLDFENFIILQ